MQFRINRHLSLVLETQQTFTSDDLLEGQRWQEHPHSDPALGPNYDAKNYTSAGLALTLGKKQSSEPLWWLNPLDPGLIEVNDLKAKVARIPEFTDGDDDGVIDLLDREPNTPAGCPVDTHGVQLDSDKDGVPDCRDKEPYSIPGARVDADGVAEKKPEKVLPDMDSIMAMVKRLDNCGGSVSWYLPMIHFDLDKDYIKPQYYPEMYHVAQVMQQHPEIKVYVDGHTDIRMPNSYNEGLSNRRATNAKNFIVKNYGISPDRLFGIEVRQLI